MSFGRTWWGKRWLRTLEQLGLTYPDSRMPKARSLANNGAVDLMNVDPGELSAWVDQPRKSFGVTVKLPTFTASQWDQCDAVVAARLGNLADLLDDQLPSNIDRQLEQVGMSLFPGDGELSAECPCSDRTATCIHIMAMMHAFAERFDDDPFALALLRGRSREAFLGGIRTARPPITAVTIHGGGVPIADLRPGDFYSAHGEVDTIVR